MKNHKSAIYRMAVMDFVVQREEISPNMVRKKRTEEFRDLMKIQSAKKKLLFEQVIN